MVDLPTGFELEQKPQSSGTPIPEGFSLEATATPATASIPEGFVAESATESTPAATLRAGVLDQITSLAKGVPMGIKSIAAGALQGVAGAQATRPEYESGMSPLELALEGKDEAFTQPPPTGAPLPTKEHPLYRAGEALGEWGSETLKPTPGAQFAYDVGSGAGSVLGAIGMSILSPSAAMLTMVASGSGEATERAVKAGATPEQIANATRWGTASGATDFVDILLPTLGTPGKVMGLLGKVGSKVLIGALAEGGQEGLQQFIQNLIAKGIYKPDQDVWEDVPYSALVGAVVGGAAKPLLDKGESAPVTAPPNPYAPPGSPLPPSPTDPIAPLAPPPGVLPPGKGPTGNTTDWRTLLGELEAEQQGGSVAPQPASYVPPPLEPGAADALAMVNPVPEDRPLPPLGQVLPGSEDSVVAYHGSPYEFGEFDASKIGTGEGAASFGRGLYFAENEAVADSYRKGLSDREFINAAKDAYSEFDDPAEAERSMAAANLSPQQREIFAALKEDDWLGFDYPHQAISAALRQPQNFDLSERTQKALKGVGNLYQVRIKASRDKFLDWDKPLNQQSPYIQGLFMKAGMPLSNETGGQFYNRLAMREPGRDKVATTQLLHKMGIPGIRYLDQHSRTGGTGTSNYVVFDPSTIGITHRNGAPVMVRSQIAQLMPKAAAKQEVLKRVVVEAIRKVAGDTAANRVLVLRDPKVLHNHNGAWGSTSQPLTAAGYYSPAVEDTSGLYGTMELLFVSMYYGQDSIQTAFHEAWHAIEATLSREEVQTLIAATPQLREYIARTIPSRKLSAKTIQQEEVWAEAAGLYAYQSLLEEFAPGMKKNVHPLSFLMEDRASYRNPSYLPNVISRHLHPAVKAIFDKIVRYIRDIRASAEQLGFRRAEDIFEAFYQGENISRREALAPTGKPGPNKTDIPGGRGDRWWERHLELTSDSNKVPADNLNLPTSNWKPSMIERQFAVEQGYAEQLVAAEEQLSKETDRNISALRNLEKDGPVVYAQYETLVPKAGARAAFAAPGGGGSLPPQIAQAAAHADRMNWWLKWMWGLGRLVDLNPNFGPLIGYYGVVNEIKFDVSRIDDRAVRIGKAWRSLGKDGEGLAALIDDITNMVYLTPAQRAAGVTRHPTAAEFNALVAKHKVGNRALRVFAEQKKFFETAATLEAQAAIDTIRRLITDPVEQAKRITDVHAHLQNLLDKPYFPFLRFGNHYLQVKDSTGVTVFFTTVERRGIVSANAMQKRKMKELQRQFPASQGFTVKDGLIPEQATPYIGMSPMMLELIGTQLNLSQAQKDALEQLKLMYSPAASFAHRYQHKNYTPGYSLDFARAYARYAFSFARHYANVKHMHKLEKHMRDAEGHGRKGDEIAAYMTDHFQNVLQDQRGTYGIFSGAAFNWFMGFSPAAAVANLSQFQLSYSFLAGKFGVPGLSDARAIAFLTKSLVNWKNFYRKGEYKSTATAFHERAMAYGIQTKRISETMAAELAGMAQGEGLLSMGNSRTSRGIQIFLEKGSMMFELAEQLMRRVTYTATLDMAMRYPNSKGVKEAMAKHKVEYDNLVAKGWNPAEARAVVSAAYVTEQTQFVYGKEDRARFMRGKVPGVILLYKSFFLNTIQVLLANKASVMPRYMLLLWAMAGFMGLPGAEDLDDIFSSIGRHFFGKDFKVSRKVREMLMEVTSKENADLLLHGYASQGFGLHALNDMMGMSNYPIPNVDMSRNVGLGRILPFEVGKVLDPGKNQGQILAEETQRASGPAVSLFINIYKALMDRDTPASDVKRWEPIMPRQLGSMSKALRVYNEGFERSARGGPNSGAPIVKFDKRDPTQFMEILSMAAGFNPTVLTKEREAMSREQELNELWDLTKEGLMISYHEALEGGKPQEIEAVRRQIEEYNNSLPERALGKAITDKGIEASMQKRMTNRVMKEEKLPKTAGESLISDYVRKLYPNILDMKRR